MTLPEWTAAIKAELQSAGYMVEEYQGFPLVRVPVEASHEWRYRFLKFHTKLPADRRIYDVGCLFVPHGSPR